MKSVYVWIVVMVCLMVLDLVQSYPNGPPVDSEATLCMDMMPKHGYPPQNSVSPFTLSLSQNCYNGMGGSITVTIQGNGLMMEGFFVQARKAGSNITQSYGSFMVQESGQKQLSCNGANNAIGHSDKSKRSSTSFSWYPGNVKADIFFIATVVEHTDTFWVGVKSDILKFDSACNMVVPTKPPMSALAPQYHGSWALLFAMMIASMLIIFKSS